MPEISQEAFEDAQEQFLFRIDDLLDDPSDLLHPWRDREPAEELGRLSRIAQGLGLDFDELISTRGHGPERDRLRRIREGVIVPRPREESKPVSLTVPLLVARAGGLRDAKWVAKYLGIDAESLVAKARRNEMLVVIKDERDLYPAFQFRNGQVMVGLQELLQALPLIDGWSRLSFLLSPDPALNHRTPVEAIDTERETVLALAGEVDTQGAG